MKFNVEGKKFLQQLQAVSKVISPKNTIKILDNFLLRIEGRDLCITGGDSENVISAYIPIFDIEGAGAIAVNARQLLEMIKEIDNQPLQFNVNDETHEIDLTFLNGHFNFMGVDAEEYPAYRKITEGVEMRFPAQPVLKGLENTAFAVSTETSRPVMTGIFWDIHENDITFVSSDTHKLVKYVNEELQPGLEASFIMPSKTANIIRSLIKPEDLTMHVKFDQKGGLFEVGEYRIYSVFINGTYPNYNRVIPTKSAYGLIVDRASLINALRRVNLFAPKSSNLVVLNLEPGEIRISAQDLDYGRSAQERVNCEYEGSSMTIGFNGVFMVEILNNMHIDEVLMQVTDPGRPCIYSAYKDKQGEKLVTIQMPMQVL